MTADELLEKIWQQIEPGVFISRREFVAGLDGWDIVAREIGGEVAGATLTCGPNFHFISFGKRKVVPPSLMFACLQPIIEQHGFVKTRTPKDDTRQRRFNERIGFHVESDDEYYTYFRMEHLKLHGAKQCQS